MLKFGAMWLARIISHDDLAIIALKDPPLALLIWRMYAIRGYVGI